MEPLIFNRYMTINYPKQLIFLNIILSVLTYILIFKAGTISNIEDVLFLALLPGFIASFFIKEHSSARYLKLIFFNSLIFGFLFALILIFYEFILYSDFHVLKPFIGLFLFCGVLNLFGGLAGIIPKGIIERLKIEKN